MADGVNTDEATFVRALGDIAGAMNDTLDQLIVKVSGPEGRVVDAMRQLSSALDYRG